MPLVLHQSSICDVCQDPFTWDDQDKTPHAIPCGHVFCRGCLRMMHPTNCPLCRKPYLYDRVKKLHVDRYEAVDDSSAPAFKLLQKIAMASAESASTGEMTQAANEAQEWLASQTGENRASSLSHQMAVRYAVESLHRVRIVQEESLKKGMRLSDEIARLEKEKTELENRNSHLEDMEKYMIGAANDKDDKHKLLTAKFEKKVKTLQEELDRLTEENKYFRARFLNGNNPLPPPPQPLGMDQLGSSDNSGEGPSRQQTLPSIPESPETFGIHLRPPVMVPGAPPPMKVVPPRANHLGQVWQYNSQARAASIGSTSEQPQLDIRNTRAGPADVPNIPSASSESLERVSNRADQGPRRGLQESGSRSSGETHGLELEGLNRSTSNHTPAEVQPQATGLALDPNPGSQLTSRSSAPDAQVTQQVNGNTSQQRYAVFALPQNPVNSSPGATPRQSTHHLPDSTNTAAESGDLSELDLAFAGLPSIASNERAGGVSQTQQPTRPNSQRLYSLAPAASSASTWGTVHSLASTRESSFSNLPLQSLPDPVPDSQPPSANPSISSLQQLPELPGFQTSSSDLGNTGIFSQQPSRHGTQSSQTGPSNSYQRNPSMTSLPLTQPQPMLHFNQSSVELPRSTSSLNLGLMGFGNASRVDLSLQPSNTHRASSSQSNVPEFASSESLTRSTSTRNTPSRTQSTRPNAGAQHLNSASSHSLPESRSRRHTVSEDRRGGESHSKSVSQPSLPSSHEGRPLHSRHASTPVATLPGVGTRTGVPIYLSSNSAGNAEVATSSNSVALQDSISHPHPRSATAHPQTTPSEEPLTREPLRAQRRQSGRHVTSPAILTQTRSERQSSTDRTNTFSVSSESHPRPSTSFSIVDLSAPPIIGGGLLLTTEPPSTSSAATADGQPNASIHAPRPVNQGHRRSGSSFLGIFGRSGR